MDDVKDVHELSLVFMNTLDLDIVKSVEWNIKSSLLLDPLLKLGLIGSLDSLELLYKVFVSGVWLKLLEVIKGSNPLIDSSESITDQF